MFKLEQDLHNNPDFTFENCYEISNHANIPKKLTEFGQTLNYHGSKFVRILKEQRKYEEARDV